ncbi:MAG: DedA family protein [Aeromicrobium sp.]
MTRALLGFLFALAESGLGLGAIVPGEVAISSLAASAHDPFPILALGLAVTLGAVAGDHIGFLVGHFGGARLRESRLVRRLGVERWDKAADLMQRHGFWAVLGSRVLPVVRTVMPVVAGAAALRYRNFLAASIIGGIGWSAVWVGAGAGIGATGILDHPLLVVGVVAVALLVVGVRALLRRRRRVTAATSDETVEDDRPVDVLACQNS